MDYFQDISNFEDYLFDLEWYEMILDSSDGINIGIGHAETRPNYNRDIPIGHDYSEKNVNIKQNDIIGFGSFQFIDNREYIPPIKDGRIKRANFIHINGRNFPIGLSKEFFLKNNKIFQNITKQIIRNKKLNQLI